MQNIADVIRRIEPPDGVDDAIRVPVASAGPYAFAPLRFDVAVRKRSEPAADREPVEGALHEEIAAHSRDVLAGALDAQSLLARGVAEGALAADIDPLRLYVMIAALSQFHLTNVYTLSSMFASDLADPAWRASRREDARKMLAAYLKRS